MLTPENYKDRKYKVVTAIGGKLIQGKFVTVMNYENGILLFDEIGHQIAYLEEVKEDD